MLITHQDRQCTYNVTLKRVRESPLPWKSNKYCICVRVRKCVRVSGDVGVRMRVRACSLAYPACNKNAPYYGGLCLHHILPHYLINDTIFEEKKSY
jgi:hypothetical protein